MKKAFEIDIIVSYWNFLLYFSLRYWHELLLVKDGFGPALELTSIRVSLLYILGSLVMEKWKVF